MSFRIKLIVSCALLMICATGQLPKKCTGRTYLSTPTKELPQSTCQSCPWYCIECSEKNSCDKCFDGGIFDRETDECKCPSGQFISAYHEKCQPCGPNCAQCHD